MSDLDAELRALAEGVQRPGVNEAAANGVSEATRRFGRVGSLTGWWANVHPSGPPAVAALAWADPGWDGIAVPHGLSLRAESAPSGVAGDATGTFAAAVGAADALVDRGADIVLVHVDADAAARRLICTMLTLDASEAYGWPRSVEGRVVPSDQEWIEAVAALRDDLRELRGHAGRPAQALEALDDPLLISGTALILDLAVRRCPMILTGLGALACASIVRRIAPAAFAWWQIADTVDDPLHARLLSTSNLTPVLAHGSGADGLLGGRLALTVVETAARLLAPAGP